MSVLKKNHPDVSHVLDWKNLRIHIDLSYEEKPVRIVDKKNTNSSWEDHSISESDMAVSWY